MAKPRIFFDCWDTLIRFKRKDERWTIIPIYDHALNKDEIDWEQVAQFANRFEEGYYSSHSLYEIPCTAYHRLITERFSIKLDCSFEVTDKEVMDFLDPSPVLDICDFLSLLEKNGIRYACLSNTRFSEKTTCRAIERQIPGHHLDFVLASSEIGVKKPNSDFFYAGLRIAHVQPENAIYIGDSYLQDVFGSFNAGFAKSYWLNFKGGKPFYLESFPKRKERKYKEVLSYDEIAKDLGLK